MSRVKAYTKTSFGWNTGPTEFVSGMTIAKTKKWVGDNLPRAQAALLAEEADSDPRSTLISWLHEVIENG